jgi:hypothetical protein
MALFFSCQKGVDESVSANASAELRFHNMVGPVDLTFNTPYTDPFGEQFVVTKLKYYITNIQLLNTSSNTRFEVSQSYFLVDEQEALSKTFNIQIPSGKYNAISFLIGVDSLHNVSGAQSGALDPAKDMFWTWNSGYIMAKLEGNSPVSTLANQMIEFHIGGFKGTDNVVKRLILNFPSEKQLLEKGHLAIDISADINAWFKSMHDLPISANATCTSPGSLAKQYADNYAMMFSISSVVNR